MSKTLPNPLIYSDPIAAAGQRLLTYGYSGKAILRYAASLPLDERPAYLATAMAHIKRMIGTKWRWRMPPVDVRTFMESPEFLNQAGVIYPEVMKHLIQINSGRYVECVLTGGIGSAKTSIAVWTQAYQTYIMSCLDNPQREFGLAPTHEIVIVMQSINKDIAKKGDYARFRSLIDQSPYFQNYFPYNKTVDTELQFPKRIYVLPLSGNPQAAIGKNVIGAILDEVNFMVTVEKSKNSADGGTFDQANEMYNSIVQRRKTRFVGRGMMPGMLCLVSSKRYPGELTDVKAAEAIAEKKKFGHSSIYVYDKRVWEIKPKGSFEGIWFNVFAGDASRKPRILGDDETLPEKDAHLVMRVPGEFRTDFERDLLSAIRNIAGMSTLALHPFIIDSEAVAVAFGKTPSILSREDCDFATTTVQIYPNRIIRPAEPRFAHIDLSITSDSTGLAIGHVEKFVEISRGSYSEIMPLIVFDAILEVKPPKGGEIEFAKIRAIIYKLRELGMNLKWVSLDTFQSVDTMQILSQQGFVTGKFSLDTAPIGHELAKTAFYDHRIKAPVHEKVLKEYVSLERDPQTGKVDHRADGSKDCADAMSGVIYGLTTRREIWHRHNIAINRIPGHLLSKTKEEPDKQNAVVGHKHKTSIALVSPSTYL